MKLDKALSIDDLQKLAKRRLPRVVYDFVDGGAEDEHCLERNYAAYRRQYLFPRYLVDITTRDQSMELFGETFSSPFGVAPMGIAAMAWPKADLRLAEAAAAANIPFVISGSSTATIEDVAKVWPKAWYQLYIPKTNAYTEEILRRADAAGLKVLVVTVDVPIHSKRERNIRSGFVRPYTPTLPVMFEALKHPAWVFDYLRTGLPYQENWIPFGEPGWTSRQLMSFYAKEVPALQTWQTLDYLRKLWPGKLVVKGVLHPEDAVKAANAGADGIIVSNHGGRQQDRAPTPIDAFDAINKAVGDRLTLMIDSGIKRGSDVVAALCHGAKFTFVGRGMMYGVAAGGFKGAKKAMDILRSEVDIALGQIGCPNASKLGPQFLYHGPGA